MKPFKYIHSPREPRGFFGKTFRDSKIPKVYLNHMMYSYHLPLQLSEGDLLALEKDDRDISSMQGMVT